MRHSLEQRTTIKDVAKAAGVSISTVSRVMNSPEDVVISETQRRVLAAIRKLKYSPNPVASSLRNDRSNTLGIVVPNVLNPFFTTVFRSVQDNLKRSGYETIICNTDDSFDDESHAVQMLLSRRTAGLIVASCTDNRSVYEELVAQRYPLVLIDRPIPGLNCDTVTVDNVSVCEMVVNRLLTLGHERIGILTPPLGSVIPRLDRVEGCRRGMRGHGRELDPDLIIEVDFHRDSGEKATARLLSQSSPPTALFALNTFLAMGCLKELGNRKETTREELAFVMFDDPEWSELLTPRLAAVQQPIQDIGRAATRLVLERINDPQKAFENIRLEAKLIERESMLKRSH